jgi:beta-glucosidase
VGTDTQVFFTAGKPRAGWRWVVGGVATNIKMSPTDRAAQEDALQIIWGNAGPASVGLATTAPINLQRETNGQLSVGFDFELGQPFDYRIGRTTATTVTAGVECGPGCHGTVDLTKTMGQTPVGQWAHLRVPLSCFANAGARMDAITQPFQISSTGPFELSVANVQLETATDALVSCPGGTT